MQTQIVDRAPSTADTRLEAKQVRIFYGDKEAVKGVDVAFRSNTVNALIGPSGCGKTTFLRAVNRMHDLTPGARVMGQILLDGHDLYGAGVDPVDVRRRIGMVFQKPNPFPTMSIYDNVAAGLKLAGERNKSKLDEIVERSLRGAALWDEVKDRLKMPGSSLSGGQQQRLCIARALAVEPEILLMDEPTSALDPQSTARIEDLMESLKEQVTIVIVTHNMQQASRVSDTTSFFLLGDLIEHAPTSQLFTAPRDERTEAYISGRFG
jgi:phosphate transport system ATP-binding protein